MSEHCDDWTLEKERDRDPGNIQKEYVDVVREMIKVLKSQQESEKKQEEKRLKVEDEFKKVQGEAPPLQQAFMVKAYQPPLLSTILARYAEVWSAIVEKFDDPVIRRDVFGVLLHVSFRLPREGNSDDESVSA